MSKYRKFVVAVAGILATAIPLSYPHVTWGVPLVATLTAVAVYFTPNKGA
jgi:hypothetical protein